MFVSITEVCLSLLLKCVRLYYRSVFVAVTEVCLSLLLKCVCREGRLEVTPAWLYAVPGNHCAVMCRSQNVWLLLL